MSFKQLPAWIPEFLFLGILITLATSLVIVRSPSPPDCADERTFCIGLVTTEEGLEDGGLNQQTWEALRRSRVADRVEHLESQDSRDYLPNIVFLVEEHYDLVVTVGPEAKEATIQAAKRYPHTYFIGVDQHQDTILENLAGLTFPEDQAGFLAGAMAVQVSSTGRVAAICSTSFVPSYWRYCEGFRAGVAYADPQVQSNILYNNSYPVQKAVTALAWAETTTRILLSTGVDVVFADPTPTGQAALQTAAKGGATVIGSRIDWHLRLPEIRSRLLTSVVPLVMPGLLDLVRAAHQDQAKAGSFQGGNYNGQVGWAPFYGKQDSIPIETFVYLERIRRALERGELETGVPPHRP